MIHCLWVIPFFWVFILSWLVSCLVIIWECYVPHSISAAMSIFCRAYRFEDCMPKVHPFQSYTPSSTNCTCVSHALFISWYLLVPILCHWWGTHYCPPSKSLFLSTSTHHLRIRLRNHLVPWNLHASMVGILIFESLFTSLNTDKKIPWMFNYDSFMHISLECTIVPWESSSSLVISLAVVNGIHQWPVIKRFLPCLTSQPFFTWLELYYLGLDEDLGFPIYLSRLR